MATINSQNITTYIYKYSKFILNGFEEFVLKSKDIIWEHFAIKMLKTDKLQDKKQKKTQCYLSVSIEFYWLFHQMLTAACVFFF